MNITEIRLRDNSSSIDFIIDLLREKYNSNSVALKNCALKYALFAIERYKQFVTDEFMLNDEHIATANNAISLIETKTEDQRKNLRKKLHEMIKEYHKLYDGDKLYGEHALKIIHTLLSSSYSTEDDISIYFGTVELAAQVCEYLPYEIQSTQTIIRDKMIKFGISLLINNNEETL